MSDRDCINDLQEGVIGDVIILNVTLIEQLIGTAPWSVR
jgi:hypothetical protein